MMFRFLLGLDTLDSNFPPLKPLDAKGTSPCVEQQLIQTIFHYLDQDHFAAQQRRCIQSLSPARSAIIGGLNAALSAPGSLSDYFPDVWATSESFGKGEIGAVWLTNDPPMTDYDIEQALKIIDLSKDIPDDFKDQLNTLTIRITAEGLRQLIQAAWAKLPKRYDMNTHEPDTNGNFELTGTPSIAFDGGAKTVSINFNAVLHPKFPDNPIPWDQNVNCSIVTKFDITYTNIPVKKLAKGSQAPKDGTYEVGFPSAQTKMNVSIEGGSQVLDFLFLPGGPIALGVIWGMTAGDKPSPLGADFGMRLGTVLPRQFLVNQHDGDNNLQKVVIPYLDVEVSDTKGVEFFCGPFKWVARQPKASIVGPAQISGDTSASGAYQLKLEDLRPGPMITWMSSIPGTLTQNPFYPDYAGLLVGQHNVLEPSETLTISAKAVDSDQQEADAPSLGVVASFKGGDEGQDEGGWGDYGQDSSDWEPPPEYNLKIVSYDKTGTAGLPMSHPVVIHVDDPKWHKAVGLTVFCDLEGPADDGSFSGPGVTVTGVGNSCAAVTDSNGDLSLVVTLGSVPGSYRLKYQVKGYQYYLDLTAKRWIPPFIRPTDGPKGL